MIDDLLKDATDRMVKAVEAIRREFTTVRTGRASPHILDRIVVDYYGAQTPLNQLAQISATEARLLTITPYDKSGALVAVGIPSAAITTSSCRLTRNAAGVNCALQLQDSSCSPAGPRSSRWLADAKN